MAMKDDFYKDLTDEEQAEQAARAQEATEKLEAQKQLLEDITNGGTSPVDFEPVTAETAMRVDKLFTQDEVNKIVSDRLTRYRAKETESITERAKQLDELMKDLERREIEHRRERMRDTAVSELRSYGLPTTDSIIDLVTDDDVAEMKRKIEALSLAVRCYPSGNTSPGSNSNKMEDPIRRAMELE